MSIMPKGTFIFKQTIKLESKISISTFENVICKFKISKLHFCVNKGGQDAGDLGWFRKGKMNKAFETAAYISILQRQHFKSKKCFCLFK